MHVVAPNYRTQFFKNINQTKREQHLVKVIAFVKVPEQQPFKRQAKSNGQHSAQQNRQRQATKSGAKRPCQIGAQHIKTAMRQVHHTHDAENQRQARSQHEQ